jgi:hypothetical protein
VHTMDQDAKLAAPPSQKSPATVPTHENYRIGGTHLRTPPDSDGRRHKLLVSLPYRYQENPHRRFPVLYLCDGYWDFLLILGLYGPLWADRAIEEFITVGLAYGTGYPDDPGVQARTTDLVPTPADTLHPAPPTPSAQYLECVTDVFAPFIEREYRADVRRRVIAGSSIGATFSLMALLRKPDFFCGSIALSPCLDLGNNAVQRCEEEFYRGRQPQRRWFPLPVSFKSRVFIAVGGADERGVVEPAKAFDRHLDRRKYIGFDKSFWIATGETHATIKGEGFTRGLAYLFGPPEGRARAKQNAR